MNANDKCLMSALDSVDILLISVRASLTAADMIGVRAFFVSAWLFRDV